MDDHDHVPQRRICPGPICRRECCHLLPKTAIIAQPEVTLVVLRSLYDEVLVAKEIRYSVWLLVRHYCYIRTEALKPFHYVSNHMTFDLGVDWSASVVVKRLRFSGSNSAISINLPASILSKSLFAMGGRLTPIKTKSWFVGQEDVGVLVDEP